MSYKKSKLQFKDPANSGSLVKYDKSKRSLKSQRLMKRILKVSSNLKLEIIANNGYKEKLWLYSDFAPSMNNACKTPILSKILRKDEKYVATANALRKVSYTPQDQYKLS